MASIFSKITDLFKTERKEPRFAAFGEFPGVFKGENGQEYTVIPIDISKRGLGLLIDPAPIQKDVLVLELKREGQDYEIRFKVVHVSRNTTRPINSLEKMRRCGMELIDSKDINLLEALSGKDYLMVQE